MQTFPKWFLFICLILLLSGCNDTWKQLKEAASGINTAADQAATAISQDVHSLRAFEISYNEKNFTINDLFKTILRDVQWHYENNTNKNTLRITGTAQLSVLESLNIQVDKYNHLSELGEMEVYLYFSDETLLEEYTTITVFYDGDEIFSKKGQALLLALYDAYTNM